MSIEISQVIVDSEIQIERIIFTFERITAQINYMEVVKDSDGIVISKQQGFVPKNIAIPWILANMPSAQTLFNELEKWRRTKLPVDATVNLVPNTDVDITLG